MNRSSVLYASYEQAIRSEFGALECRPGEELELDLGSGAPIDESEGKTRRSWVLRLVLSYSRKGYREALYRQDTNTLLRCLENVYAVLVERHWY
jgi:hypothetical protein